MVNENNTGHKWSFFRLGGFDQVRLDSGADLLALPELNPKLWAVLSCPASGLEFDERTLALIDTDGDGRIRVPDILEALEWTLKLLKSPDCLINGGANLELDSIDDSTPLGKAILASAKQILENLGKSTVTFITEDDSDDETEIFANTPFNGDGVITRDAADEETAVVVSEIMLTVGSVKDRNGEDGISMVEVKSFFDSAEAYSVCWKRAEEEGSRVLPLKEKTASAEDALFAVEAKIDDYFTRCKLAAFDRGSIENLNPAPEAYKFLGGSIISLKSEEMRQLPLSEIGESKPLPLNGNINPAWQIAISSFEELVVRPILGKKEELTYDEWKKLVTTFAPFRKWKKEIEGCPGKDLGAVRIGEILSGNYRKAIEELINTDLALQPEADGIAAVDKLVRLHRNLYTLLNNFVSLRDFYSPDNTAIFQVGTLYIDGRSCDLCIKVDDIAKHSAIAPLSRTYLLYCECSSKKRGKPFNIMAAMTAGDGENIKAGRNGVFYDRAGRDWDATIVKIVENPISVRQAFWSPYKRIASLVSDQVEKMVDARAKEVEKSAASEIATVAIIPGVPVDPKVAEKSFDIARFAGIFAAIGIALGAIGAAVASLFTGFISLPWWQMPIVLLGIPLILSGPSMIVAYIKLRGRNLGPLLDANGWAVNTRATINIPFGRSLTKVAELPQGATFTYDDPYVAESNSYKRYTVLILVDLIALWLLYRGWLTIILYYLFRPLGAIYSMFH
jgi:hypothetical protein